MSVAVADAFEAGIQAGNCAYRKIWYFNEPGYLTTGTPFTKTEVNCTSALAFVGNRPCVSLAGSGASTDGACYQIGTANLRFVSGKRTRIFWGWRSADVTNHSVWMGYAIVSTTLAANFDGGTPGTDYFGINKKAGTTNTYLRTRKASGTEEATLLSNLSLANDTWYEFELLVIPSGSGAATGKLFVATALASKQILANVTITAQLPDSVSTALGFSMLAGSSNTSATVVSHIGIEQEG